MPGKDTSTTSQFLEHVGDMYRKTDRPSTTTTTCTPSPSSPTRSVASASSISSIPSAMTRGQILPPREVKPAAAAATTTNDAEEEDEDFVFIGKGKAVKARDEDDDGASSSSGSSGGVRLSKTDEPEEGEKFPEYDEDLAMALLCEEDEE